MIVAKRDRLGRDVLNVAMIERLVERKAGRIVSPDAPETNDPSSTLMRQIIDCFAQYERAVIRSRTKAAMEAKKRRGERAGHIAFSWRVAADGRTLLSHEEEQAVLAELRRLRAKGYALIDIASELNARGLRNRQGRVWRRQFIAQLLHRHPC